MWVKAAEGKNADDLKLLIADRDLPKGTKIRIEFNCKSSLFAKRFDFFDAEYVFAPYVPDGVDLIDVHSEGNLGVIECEADPPVPLIAIVAFAVRLLVIGAIVAAVVIGIKVFIDVAGVTGFTPAVLIFIAIGLLVLFYVVPKIRGVTG